MNEIIQSLWIGDTLSTMEQLSMNSFIKNGHEYHLYTYDTVRNIPDGVIVKDGNDILPKDSIFTYKHGDGKGSVSAFSNVFRYKLLYDKGGYWVDTDVVCLKKWDFGKEYVFASEKDSDRIKITSCVIKTPKQNQFAKYCYERCSEIDLNNVIWGQIGPTLVGEGVSHLGLDRYVVDTSVFCPIKWFEANKSLDPSYNSDLLMKKNYAIHMWHEVWRRNGADKDAQFHPDCLYEKLKKEYL